VNQVKDADRHPSDTDVRRLVGRNFVRIRRDKHLTQEEVQARSDFSQQYLSGLEQGRRNPTIVTLYELAAALGVSHVDLVTPDSTSRSMEKKKS
jgi:transcriptional regulator with XRE-family HTH domain